MLLLMADGSLQIPTSSKGKSMVLTLPQTCTDLSLRLRDGETMNHYDRSRFYGPFEDRELGYTDYPRL